MRASPKTPTWDIFCRVVDNFGDIGFCWRLARCLAQERRGRIRLWVDDLARFARIEPRIEAGLSRQTVEEIEVIGSGEPTVLESTGEVVIQSFGSPLPAYYYQAMLARRPPPAWIDLEYLSAESWVEAYHKRPSPDPLGTLVKHFYFPGFTPESGGLLRERDLETERAHFLADPKGLAGFWAMLGLAPQTRGERRISLFCYPNPAAVVLFETLASDDKSRWSVLVPEGTLKEELAARFGTRLEKPGDVVQQRALSVHVIPFLSQNEYDRLLWACDVNFVRGEDSFVRAQWARRPFIWNIYPQEGEVHFKKLDAFLARYTAGWPAGARQHLSALWRAWNAGSPTIGDPWRTWCEDRAQSEDLSLSWASGLQAQSDLATRLAQFALELLK